MRKETMGPPPTIHLASLIQEPRAGAGVEVLIVCGRMRATCRRAKSKEQRAGAESKEQEQRAKSRSKEQRAGGRVCTTLLAGLDNTGNVDEY